MNSVISYYVDTVMMLSSYIRRGTMYKCVVGSWEGVNGERILEEYYRKKEHSEKSIVGRISLGTVSGTVSRCFCEAADFGKTLELGLGQVRLAP